MSEASDDMIQRLADDNKRLRTELAEYANGYETIRRAVSELAPNTERLDVAVIVVVERLRVAEDRCAAFTKKVFDYMELDAEHHDRALKAEAEVKELQKAKAMVDLTLADTLDMLAEKMKENTRLKTGKK